MTIFWVFTLPILLSIKAVYPNLCGEPLAYKVNETSNKVNQLSSENWIVNLSVWKWINFVSSTYSTVLPKMESLFKANAPLLHFLAICQQQRVRFQRYCHASWWWKVKLNTQRNNHSIQQCKPNCIKLSCSTVWHWNLGYTLWAASTAHSNNFPYMGNSL